MEKHVLMIAYHYPPCRGSSGVQRTLSFSRDLPSHGWTPLVLTAHVRAYPQVGADQVADIPARVPVTRASAWDAAKHLALRGRYVGWSALPDRWVSWFFGAVPAGLRLIHRYRPKILWSTYPIATAHLIGFALHRLTGIPWIADFRDPMTEIDPVTRQQIPTEPSVWRARQAVERWTVRHSHRSVFVTPGALRLYAERYPWVPRTRWATIANGYDEESFVEAERLSVARPTENQQSVLVHSGTLYPLLDRDPSAFFAALAQLRAMRQIAASNLHVILRASGYEQHYQTLIRRHELEDLVALKPAIPYREALAEMLAADGLLLFQGYTSNPAIPGKLYEYLRARRPIFAMVDARGDTAAALQSAGIGTLAPLDSPETIAERLLLFLRQLREQPSSTLTPAQVRHYSRAGRARELAQLFDTVMQ